MLLFIGNWQDVFSVYLKHCVMDKLMKYWIAAILVVFLSSCDLAVDIFQGGMWVGAILVVIVLSAVIWIFSKFR